MIAVFTLLAVLLGTLLQPVRSETCGVQCPTKSANYSKRSTMTYICDHDTTPSPWNNYCVRDDNAAYKEDGQFSIIANGCPGHPFFVNSSVPASFSRSGPLTIAGATSLSCNPSFDYINPFTPRFQKYELHLPTTPRVSDEGKRYLNEIFSSGVEEHFIGIAINGVLITTSNASNGSEDKYDSCGGFADMANRYFYDGPPICLLSSMGGTIPLTGARFLSESSSDSQLSQWKMEGKPSPLVGYALDGFPIFGPYNDSGHLQIAGRSELDACLFNVKTQNYHLTANFPFSPPCIVGEVGTYSRKLINEGKCVIIDSAFCTGESCQPQNQECEYLQCEFMQSKMWVFTLCVAVTLLFMLLLVLYMQCKHPNTFSYPLDKVLLSILPAVFFVTVHQPLMKSLFGLNKTDFFNFDLDMEAIANHLGNGISAYLAVTGVLYTLITAQIFIMVDDKFKQMRDALSEELSGCRQIVLCLQAMHTESSEANQLKEKAISRVIWFVGSVIKYWGEIESFESRKSLDLLYGTLSTVDKLCKCGTDINFNVQVADRIMDSMNSISNGKYRRSALEDQGLSPLLWLLQYSIATAMFLGVLLIQTGSVELNLVMCYMITLLIGMNSLVIADMDMPYGGWMHIKVDVVIELFNYLEEIAHRDAKEGVSLAKQSSEFFSSRDDRRKSLAFVQEFISTKSKAKNKSYAISVNSKIIPHDDGTFPSELSSQFSREIGAFPSTSSNKVDASGSDSDDAD